MSSEKTEKPTEKKIRDAAEKGQSFRARDLMTAFMLLCACGYLAFALSFSDIRILFTMLIEHRFNLYADEVATAAGAAFFKMTIPIIVLCIVTTALPSLILTRFILATKAIKIDFDSLNPVNGFKKIFNLRMVKEFIKAILYIFFFTIAVYIFWEMNKRKIFMPLNGQLLDMIVLAPKLFFSLVVTCLSCLILIFILDTISEYFLHIRSLKMDKREIKQEYKEQEGNQEIKSRRRELHIELLSEQVKNDVAQSNFITANPTHIAVGIYLNTDIAPIPFISVMETEVRALAVIAYAEKIGVPVVRDKPLAQRLYKKLRRYSFVPLSELEPIVRILVWLQEVEYAALGYDVDEIRRTAAEKMNEQNTVSDQSISDSDENKPPPQ